MATFRGGGGEAVSLLELMALRDLTSPPSPAGVDHKTGTLHNEFLFITRIYKYVNVIFFPALSVLLIRRGKRLYL